MNIKTPRTQLPQGRALLVDVLAASGDVLNIDIAAQTLGLSRNDASKRLARWTEQGWLRRVGRGAYVPASLATLGSERVLEDAWVLVPALFAPAYVGGRTAAEHWDLTEQIFKDVLVITAQAVRQTRQQRHGVPFTLKHVRADKIFGTRLVWRSRTKVPVSDVHRTIVDMIDDPALGGGMQHVSDCLAVYLSSADRDDERLIQYAERLGNGTVFKRLGFLAERHAKGGHLAEMCQTRLSTGNAKFDPALDCPRLVSKWRLRVPEMWIRGDHT
jgi:predicted transcriptional regulator of viral defense system